MNLTERSTIARGERGRLVLPARLRQRLDVHPGVRLLATVDAEGGCRIVSAREQARRPRGLNRDLASGLPLADELIAERREEAWSEDAPPWDRTAGSVLDASPPLAYLPRGSPAVRRSSRRSPSGPSSTSSTT